MPARVGTITGIGAAVFIGSWFLGADNAYLYPFSLAEARLGARPAVTDEPCNPIVAAHRAYTQAGRFTDTRVALDAAVSDGITNIEIDLSLLPSGPVLLHTILHDVEEAETVAAGAMTVADFFATYAAHFDLIFFDIKNVLVPVDRGLDDLRGFPWDAARHIFVGRKCSLLRDIRHAFGLRAGCEMHGVLGNWLMGFDIWSVRAAEIRSVQFQLNRVADLPLLTWTLAAQRDVPTLCHLNPTWVLVDTM